MKNYVWHKQTVSPDLQVIECSDCDPCSVFDPIRDFHRDPTGAYVLIRCDRTNSQIETAICDKKHTIIKVFRGRKAQDVYHTIFQYQRQHKANWISTNDHAAYLGKELKKAEFSLSSQEDYVQE
jgi:hypothetical protein